MDTLELDIPPEPLTLKAVLGFESWAQCYQPYYYTIETKYLKCRYITSEEWFQFLENTQV